MSQPHFASQIIQRAWKKMLRRRRIKAVRAKRYKMGLKHNKGNFSRGNDHYDDQYGASGGADKGHKRIVGKWTPKSPAAANGRKTGRDDLSPLGGPKRRLRKTKSKVRSGRENLCDVRYVFLTS